MRTTAGRAKTSLPPRKTSLLHLLPSTRPLVFRQVGGICLSGLLFWPFSIFVWDSCFCCDCAVRVTSQKRPHGDRVSARRKEGSVFSHSIGSPGRRKKQFNTAVHARTQINRVRKQSSPVSPGGGWGGALLLPCPLWCSDFKEKEESWPFKGVVQLNLEMSDDSLDTRSRSCPHSDEKSAKQGKSKPHLYLGACLNKLYRTSE